MRRRVANVLVVSALATAGGATAATVPSERVATTTLAHATPEDATTPQFEDPAPARPLETSPRRYRRLKRRARHARGAPVSQPLLLDTEPVPLLRTLIDFDGLDQTSAKTDAEPPDTAGAASARRVVEVVNRAIRLTDTNGQGEVVRTLRSFFGNEAQAGILFDPRVHFDAAHPEAGAGSTSRRSRSGEGPRRSVSRASGSPCLVATIRARSATMTGVSTSSTARTTRVRAGRTSRLSAWVRTWSRSAPTSTRSTVTSSPSRSCTCSRRVPWSTPAPTSSAPTGRRRAPPPTTFRPLQPLTRGRCARPPAEDGRVRAGDYNLASTAADLGDFGLSGERADHTILGCTWAMHVLRVQP